MLTSCNGFLSTPVTIPTDVMETAMSTVLTASAETQTAIPTSTPIPTNTATETPVPTANPFTLVETQDGKQYINHKYGFTISFPSDFEVPSGFTTNDGLISGYFQKHLDDGGDIVTWFGIIVEDQTDGCHPKLIDSASKPVKEKQVTLGSNSYTVLYTPNLYGDYMQDVEYMTYATDLCIHFSINLTTHYFDQGSAIPGDMLPYTQDKLDGIVSTFQWIKP